MKRKITAIIALICMALCVNAQQYGEPDFVGEVLLIENDSTATPLEKNLVSTTIKADATMYIFGMGTIKEKIEINGAKSPIRANAGKIKLIVRAVDNESDPMSIVSVFKFEVKKKVRKAMLSSMGTFSGSKSGNMSNLLFSAKKYGESSYLITVSDVEAGEYGIIVTNPNANDQKSIVVSSFGVD